MRPAPDGGVLNPPLPAVGRRPAGLHPAEAARNAELTAEPSPFAPRQARRFAVLVCEQWGLPALTDSAALVVTELVTNAVLHARTTVALRLEHSNAGLRVAVRDGGAGPSAACWDWDEHRPDAQTAREHGRGLQIVRRLAAEVGTSRDPHGGSVVWALLRDAAAEHQNPSPLTETFRFVIRAGGGREPASSRRRPRGRVLAITDLQLTWTADSPQWVQLRLTSTPSHPSLPFGGGRVPHRLLSKGLHVAAEYDGIAVRPAAVVSVVEITWPDARIGSFRIPAARLRQYLTEIVMATPGQTVSAR